MIICCLVTLGQPERSPRRAVPDVDLPSDDQHVQPLNEFPEYLHRMR
ncbi:MAG: hypothetical protein JWP99_225 [Devosia sp.]|nr:hypothetical protein [Devosia sp.]